MRVLPRTSSRLDAMEARRMRSARPSGSPPAAQHLAGADPAGGASGPACLARRPGVEWGRSRPLPPGSCPSQARGAARSSRPLGGIWDEYAPIADRDKNGVIVTCWQGAEVARMGVGAFAESRIGGFLIKVLAAGMESRFRYRFFSPVGIMAAADVSAGQTVLEVGCGTGYFTVPLARLIGDQGRLVAIDVVPQSVELVSKKLQIAGLKGAEVVKADAMETDFAAGSFHVALLFGVIPAPMLPLNRLLPEMYRVLKVDGTMAVWPPIPGWLPQSVIRSGLFTFSGRRNGVHCFRRC